nr:reverse transcriptase domain-containing protein [Tanacetum cinerariifolium]
MEILMVQPWKRVAIQRITQSFSPDLEISFPPLWEEDRTKGPMIIEAEIRGHFIHRIYVDKGSASEILYEHYFNRLCPEVKNQMVSATAPLIGFSGEVIWPMGQIMLPVKIGDGEHSTSTWMNFVVMRSPSSYNGIIGRPREAEERIKVAIHPEYPKQTIAIVSTLTEEGRKALCDLLRRNLDIFSWKPTDRSSMTHSRTQSKQKSLPFFKTLKKCTKKSDFQWTTKAEVAFKQMKKLIAELPTLTAPMEKEELILYLADVRKAISAVLMMEREAKQIPFYFVSRALFHSGTSGRRLPRHAYKNGGGNSGPVDNIHGRIILHRWFRSWFDNYKSGRSRIHLRPEIQV